MNQRLGGYAKYGGLAAESDVRVDHLIVGLFSARRRNPRCHCTTAPPHSIDAICKELTQDGERLARMVKAPLDKAEAGNMHAFREICDRLEGKPAQRLEVTPVAEDATAMPSCEVACRIAWILRGRPAAKGLLPEAQGQRGGQGLIRVRRPGGRCATPCVPNAAGALLNVCHRTDARSSRE
jgi:hypothetical protein